MKKIGLFLSIISLSACTTNQPINGTAADDMAVALHQGFDGNKALLNETRQSPSAISKALLPGIKVNTPAVNTLNRRFDISVKDVPARAFYMGLVANTPVSLAISPEIKGTITLKLKQVTIEQVLQTLENLYNYAYNPIPGGYEILPNALKTKIYSVNYLELERKSRSNMNMSSGEVTQVSTSGTGSTGSNTGSSGSVGGGGSYGGGQGSTIASTIGDVTTKSTVDFWKELKLTLENLIGTEGGRSVTLNKLAGVVVVRAMPKELKQVDSYLDIVQNSMDRQVILEAKILEITLSNQYQMGIDWKLFGANLNALRSFPGSDLKLDDFPPAFRVKAMFIPEDFTATLQALELQGNVQVLSSPKVATMNNQMSAIKVGTDEFFVTGINTTNNATTTGSVSALVVTPPTPTFTPFFSGITLDVTPQVDAQNNVTLHIHPTVSLVKEQHKTYVTGQSVTGEPQVSDYPFARSTIRESDTIVHAKNGQVIVIGGLMQNATYEDVAQLPVFGNIPFLGTLLRNTKQNSSKTELVILLRPVIVNSKSTNEQLAETTQRIAGAKRGFHIGGRPDIFGTEAEVPVVMGPASGEYGSRH